MQGAAGSGDAEAGAEERPREAGAWCAFGEGGRGRLSAPQGCQGGWRGRSQACGAADGPARCTLAPAVCCDACLGTPPTPFTPQEEELFWLCLGETPETLAAGKKVEARVRYVTAGVAFVSLPDLGNIDAVSAWASGRLSFHGGRLVRAGSGSNPTEPQGCGFRRWISGDLWAATLRSSELAHSALAPWLLYLIRVLARHPPPHRPIPPNSPLDPRQTIQAGNVSGSHGEVDCRDFMKQGDNLTARCMRRSMGMVTAHGCSHRIEPAGRPRGSDAVNNPRVALKCPPHPPRHDRRIIFLDPAEWRIELSTTSQALNDDAAWEQRLLCSRGEPRGRGKGGTAVGIR